MENKIITLLTDFGTKDGYMGSVKGVIKSVNPAAEIIDISHDIEPFDIKSAAFTLRNYYSHYPKDTVHMVIVDPGVGSERRPLIVQTAHQYFVGPDNGVFHFVFSKEAYTSYKIDLNKLKGFNVSYTFHARDVFGPVAAFLSKGVRCEKLGQKLDMHTELPHLSYKKIADNTYEAKAISIDRFGNIIVGFSKYDLERMNKMKIELIKIKDFESKELISYYSQKEPGQLTTLWNSHDFLEIALVNGNAAQKLGFNKNNDTIMIKVA